MTDTSAQVTTGVSVQQMYEHYRLARTLSWQHAWLLALIAAFGLAAQPANTYHQALAAAALALGLAGRQALQPPTLNRLRLLTVLRLAFMMLLLAIPSPEQTAVVVTITTMALTAYTLLMNGPERSHD